jgi:hypothetical protein
MGIRHKRMALLWRYVADGHLPDTFGSSGRMVTANITAQTKPTRMELI